MKILIQYPSRQRPGAFATALSTVRNLSVLKDDLVVHVVLDEDDPSLPVYMAHLSTIDDIPILICLGKSESKIDAINRSLPAIDWDILLTFSDDMRFTVYGWDIMVRDQFADKDLDKFIHFWEKDSDDRVSVMDVVGRNYYLRDMWIYNPIYLSLFCDEEKTEIARLRGKYQFERQSIFIHVNPRTSGVGEEDEMLTEQQEIGWTLDQDTYLKRKSVNFGL